MIALGLAYRDEAAQAVAVPGTDLGLICVPRDRAASPRARMALQLDRHENLSSFLPLAPSAEISCEAALAWCDARRGWIADRLAGLRAAGQITITARTELPDAPPPAAGTGTAWLRHRAGQGAARRQAIDGLRRGLEGCISPTVPRAVAADETRDGVTLHLLVDRDAVRPCIEGVQRRLAALPADTRGGWDITVSGPWPAYNFCAEAEAP